MEAPTEAGRSRTRVAAYVLATAALLAITAAASSAYAARDVEQGFEDAFSVVESWFAYFTDAQQMRDDINEGCRLRAVGPMYRIAAAQEGFHWAARGKAHRRALRSWATGEFIKDPKEIRDPYAGDVGKLRKLLPDGMLTYSCYDFETGSVGGTSLPSYYVLGRPKLCGKLGDRSYYYDPAVGLRYEEGCTTTAGPGSAPIEDLLP